MCRIIFFLIGLVAFTPLAAQFNEGFNYQAVARDANGDPMTGAVNVQFVIHQGAANGPAVLNETFNNVALNPFGLFSRVIGSVEVNAFQNIDWMNGPYFLEVRIDGQQLGPITQFQAVPYSKMATSMNLEDLQNVGGNNPADGQVLKWNGTTWVPGNDNTAGGGGGTTYTPGNGIQIANDVITNTAPDQEVTITGTGGTTVTGTYPNFNIDSEQGGGGGPTYTAGDGIQINNNDQIINTKPDQVVTLEGTGGATVTGTYPNFTIDAEQGGGGGGPTYTAGDGIQINNNDQIINTKPDQVVTLEGTGGATVTGTYPNFTIDAEQGGGGGPTYTAGDGIQINNNDQIINTKPDQVVTLEGTGGATVTGNYPNFTINAEQGGGGGPTYTAGDGIQINNNDQIINTKPDQVVNITGSGGTTVTGNYPNFNIESEQGGGGPTYTAGNGIQINNNDQIINTKPDQEVTLEGTGGTTVTGNYPNFTINSEQGGGGPTYTAGNGIQINNNDQIINTKPDQEVTLEGTGGTTVTGNYPNFTIDSEQGGGGPTYTAGNGIQINNDQIINTKPDQIVNITGEGGTTVTGTYPNFTVKTDGIVPVPVYTAGNGIAINNDVITNTKPDQVVNITGSGAANVTGNYPNFNIDVDQGGGGNSPWQTNNQKIYYNDGNVGVRTNNPNWQIHLVHPNTGLFNGLGIQNEKDINTNDWNLHVSSTDQALVFVNKGNWKRRFKPDGSIVANSDRRLKQNIVRPVGILSQILALQPSIYEMIDTPGEKQWGFIAQEVEEIFPELVSYVEEEDAYMMGYEKFGVIAIQAIKEQQEKMNQMESTIQTQAQMIQELTERLTRLEERKE